MMNRSLSISYIPTLNLDQHGNPHSKYADAVHPKEWRIVKVKEKDGKKVCKGPREDFEHLWIFGHIGISWHIIISARPKIPRFQRMTCKLEAPPGLKRKETWSCWDKIYFGCKALDGWLELLCCCYSFLYISCACGSTPLEAAKIHTALTEQLTTRL